MDRVRSSTLLDDRRDACRALKALSRKHRVEVGALGMDSLKQVLEMDRTDCEIVGLALDTLCNVTNPTPFDGEGNHDQVRFIKIKKKKINKPSKPFYLHNFNIFLQPKNTELKTPSAKNSQKFS